ncbi:oviduct-specific glycoprotein [Rhipicephalus sanguineus]|nr:oviduct-specific glycoprotein [Rhipicephalus sanguineus]
MPGYRFVGLIDFIAATGLLRANLAELAGSVHKVFLRNDPRHVHTIGTSVPNPFASANRKSYSMENAMRLADSLRLVYPDRDHVCLSVSLAVYKFNVFNLDDTNSSTSPGVGSLASYVNTEFSYSELCEEYRDPHRHFDDATLSTYVHVGKAWLGFDDDTSMEIKIDKLSRKHHVGCLLADNIDLDDFRNVCKKGDFPRLRFLKRAVLSTERL